MPKFKVSVVLEQGGYSIIEAATQEEAEQILWDRVDEQGEEAIEDVTNRDFYTLDSEEVK